MLVPHHDSLALVSDGQRVGSLLPRHLTDGLHHILVDFFSIMLYIALLRIVLFVGDVMAAHHPTLLVEEQRLGGRCALVNSNNIVTHNS